MEIKYLEVLVMDNGEMICGGKSLGFITDKVSSFAGDVPISKYLHDPVTNDKQ